MQKICVCYDCETLLIALHYEAPGGGPRNENNDRFENRFAVQRAFYTAYGKQWGMKTQALLLTNGIMYGSGWTCSIAHNDKGLINLSGIDEELRIALLPYLLRSGEFPAAYGDEIYDPSDCDHRQDIWFTRLNATRVDIEHSFGFTNNLWKRLHVKHPWHLMQMKGSAATHF